MSGHFQQSDIIIIGAGLYGLYAAKICGEQGRSVIVLEMDEEPFCRATFVNQARVHMGYHYPRSLSTAVKSRGYFEKFCNEFPECIVESFEQIYATSSHFSWSTSKQFEKFCGDAAIRCEPIVPEHYFQPGLCDGAFVTTEYAFDANILLEQLLIDLGKLNNVAVHYGSAVAEISKTKQSYVLKTRNKQRYEAPMVINTTYASVNQIHAMAGFDPFPIKYELCEIILCTVSDSLKHIGLTVMDGPFFSIMPFGKTDYHSLTSVTFTPHATSRETLPTFMCQQSSAGRCTPAQLDNCNLCASRPPSMWAYMSTLAKKYLSEELQFDYVKSLYSMKPILAASEIDDSRPTVLAQLSDSPTFFSVLSGKINTVYDLYEILEH